MAMTKTERAALENLVKRLKKPRAGCAQPYRIDDEALTGDYEAVSRIYIETWLVGPLECLLAGEAKLARDMSRN